MMSYHSETTQHYNETMENLKIINETIVYLLKVFGVWNFTSAFWIASTTDN